VADPFREPVTLADADGEWSRQYAAEAARIQVALGAPSPLIEHIGSTAIPLRGKPIIDIQIAVDESRREAAISALKGLGYDHHGDGGLLGREYLTSRPSGAPPINVHVFATGDSRLADNRLIRDYLRADPSAAGKYVETKEKALRQGFADLRTYSHAKDEHVAAIRATALAWAQATSEPQ
jgi:dephospho-CoA kinase